ncbi:MAG TPA: cupin domain-containing protein [Puia sp.]|jgi:predicted cupin superfamily sugar epimerase|nr:cupin domain-containing protein [Puia sp.]
MRPCPDYWIEHLQLTPHIEGGAFRECYRSGLTIPQASLPLFFQGDRSVATSIYFLLAAGQFSAFHRIASDELWHFYYGDTLLIYEIGHNGRMVEHRLGSNPQNDESFQTVVRAGSWFASVPAPGSEYALVGCTVAPGFDFADFELADRAALIGQYPDHAGVIQRLSRG